MATAFEQLNKCCHGDGCKRILIQGGVHMGIPFGKHNGKVYCAKCLEVITEHYCYKCKTYYSVNGKGELGCECRAKS